MKLYSILIFAMLFAVPAAMPSCDTVKTAANNTVQNVTQTYFPTSNKIEIASWNLQIFGDSKTENRAAMEVITRTIRQYDIVAIQEIRDDDQSSIPILMNRINSIQGPSYQYIIGPREGRSDSKEQYLFIYNNQTIIAGQARLFPDTKDFFEREPYSVKFNARGGNFDFVLSNIHVKPEAAFDEINDLDHPMEDAKSYFGENDVIVLGDLNMDCSYFKDGTQTEMNNQAYKFIVEDWEDTTARSSSCAYDRFIIYKDATGSDYTGRYGIYDFTAGLSEELAKDVSDHKPIWAEFYTNKDGD
jgi:endonuclease/exonuclease/phosphatase family metal-dependent hydrolase